MRVVIHNVGVLLLILLLGACSPLPTHKLTGVNINENILLNVEEENLFEVEFYNDNEIHYVTADSTMKFSKHSFINLETMQTRHFDGLPSPSEKQYALIKCNQKIQTLCVFPTNESEPFFEVEIPTRNDFPILNYYWVGEDTIFIEGDRIWFVDLNTKRIKMIAESQTVKEEAFFYLADEFPNLSYIGSNHNGFYYYEITGMKRARLFFMPNDGECVLLDELMGNYKILFFDGKVFYWIGEWKYAENIETFRLDAENVFLRKEEQKDILCITSKTGQLKIYISDYNSPKIYQIPSDYFPGNSCYIDTTSIIKDGKYYNLETGEGVDYDLDERIPAGKTLPSYERRKYFISNFDQKGFLRIDVDWNENPQFDYPPIRSFSVKKITIEEIRS